MTPILVQSENNKIAVSSLSHPAVVGQVLAELHLRAKKQGYSTIIIDCSEAVSAFPNVVVPISAVLEFYRRQQRTDIEVVGLSNYVQMTRFNAPLTVADVSTQNSFLDRVWAFSDFEQVGQLVNGIVHDLEARTQFHDGVLGGIEWCLNEVMDNVLQHSSPGRPPLGHVMAQVHSNRVAICISDCGHGLLKSLSTFARSPSTDEAAIVLAVQEGVTRDSAIGQGNGLWGLHNIVHNNGGRLVITSGSSTVTWSQDDCEKHGSQLFVDHESKGVTVDFQLNAKKRISLREALNGHQPFRCSLITREDEHGCQRFPIKDQPGKTSTRLAGQHLFNRILNTCLDTDQRIILDYSGVSLVSSSYADETVGKLVVKFGFADFTQRILLRNMTETVEVIINQAVEKRIAEALRVRGVKV